jgi:hypothetical protein
MKTESGWRRSEAERIRPDFEIWLKSSHGGDVGEANGLGDIWGKRGDGDIE